MNKLLLLWHKDTKNNSISLYLSIFFVLKEIKLHFLFGFAPVQKGEQSGAAT